MRWTIPFLLTTLLLFGCQDYELDAGSGEDDDTTDDDDDDGSPGDDDDDTADDDDTGDDDTADDDDDDATPSLEEVIVGWYVYDDGIHYQTTSNPNFHVDHHGDTDLYWYEPSGGHGLLDPNLGHQQAYDLIEQHIIDHTNLDPSYLQEEFSYEGDSDLATFEWATFTYAMAYLTYPPKYGGQWTIDVEAVDDGIEVMVNAHIIGFMKLNEANATFDLDVDRDGITGVLQPTVENVIIIILVDDSAVDKYIRNLVFAYDGIPIQMGQ